MKIKIIKLQENHKEELKKIADECFGEGYIRDFPENNTLVAIMEEKVCAFSIFKDDATLKTFATSKKYQNLGIAQKLLTEMENILKEKGNTKFTVPAWKIDDYTPIERLLLKNNYQKKSETKDYWKKDCEAGVYQCPFKKEKECQCSCVFYEKNIGE